MKLNNKGFAITAVLYGLLILFVVLIGSYLTLLGTKKSRLDIITSDIEKDYEFNKEITNPAQPIYPYKTKYTGKYIFENNETKRLIFLYISIIDDEEKFNKLHLGDGKLWTEKQIEENRNSNIFSECFELEFEYLKNTVLLNSKFRPVEAS